MLHQVAGADSLFLSALMQRAFSAILPVSNLHAFERFHMGIALLALSGLFQGFSNFNRAAPLAAKPQRANAYLRPVWATRRPVCAPAGQKAMPQVSCARSAATTPALRVLRVTESDQRVKGAGRMVISGRMADVCAELDRLAALEAAQARV
ncbi:hypothetical protein B9Z33_09150 [Limnohabitans sp. T6-20]|nr:hypothetical protein B9Z33_09150 [Limnohabitans sp. T6-20]